MAEMADVAEVHHGVVGRAPMRSTPQCDDFPPSPEPGEFPGWVVALVEPQSEARSRAWLWKRARIRAWMPTMPKPRANGGVKRTIRFDPTPLLRGYLFIPAVWSEHAIALDAPGIHSFMNRDGWPVLIYDGALDPLRDAEKKFNDPKYINPETGRRFTIGESVQFISELMRNIVATVTAVDKGNRVALETADGARIVTTSDKIEPAAPDVKVRGSRLGQASQSRRVRNCPGAARRF